MRIIHAAFPGSPVTIGEEVISALPAEDKVVDPVEYIRIKVAERCTKCDFTRHSVGQ